MYIVRISGPYAARAKAFTPRLWHHLRPQRRIGRKHPEIGQIPSSTSAWKCGIRFNDPSKRWKTSGASSSGRPGRFRSISRRCWQSLQPFAAVVGFETASKALRSQPHCHNRSGRYPERRSCSYQRRNRWYMCRQTMFDSILRRDSDFSTPPGMWQRIRVSRDR